MSERGGLPLPAQPPKLPGFPSNTLPIVWEVFEGLNNHVNRVAIKDTELSICDGFVPFGPSYLSTAQGPPPQDFWVPNPPLGLTMMAYFFGNIAEHTLVMVLFNDGSVWSVESPYPGGVPISTSANQVLAAGTILNPTAVNVGFSQWSSKYIIMSAGQTNGYWLWNRTTLFGAGSLSPEVLITNSGSDYTGQPTFALQTTGAGSGETFLATIANGSITNIEVVTPGTGFALNDFNVLTITGGGSDDSAVATIGIEAGAAVSAIEVIDGGSRYSAQSYATITGDGSGASVSIAASLGVITGITVLNGGLDYTFATIAITDPAGTGGGFVGEVELSGGQIGGSPIIVSGGSGYLTPPLVTIIGDGTGAAMTAQIAGGVVTGLTFIHRGFGYTKALVQFSGGNNGASATVALMPFGISGTAIEVAFSRVWVTNGGAASNDPPKARTLFSAPGDPSDFRPSDGAGAFLGTDSFLRIGYRAMRQTNGFLYLIGDSSLNYVSGVQTTSSGTPAVAATTFTNANADPQIGSPWPSSVQVFNRNIVYANPSGVYVSYGGAVTKISEEIDILWVSSNTLAAANAGGQNFFSAVVHLYGVMPCYCILLPVLDPITGTIKNKLLCWNGKRWFTTDQGRPLTMLATQSINGILGAWASDGASLFALFAVSQSFPRMLQSKLWAVPSYFYTKTNLAVLGIIQSATAVIDNVDLYIDSENGSTGPFSVSIGGTLQKWVNNTGAVVAWSNTLAVVVFWSGVGYTVFGPLPTGQNGRLIGLTLKTSAASILINSFTLIDQEFSTNV